VPSEGLARSVRGRKENLEKKQEGTRSVAFLLRGIIWGGKLGGGGGVMGKWDVRR